jgi:hypothetical protein
MGHVVREIAVTCGIVVALAATAVSQAPPKDGAFTLSAGEVRKDGSTLHLKRHVSIATRFVEVKATEADFNTQTHEVNLLDIETVVRLRGIVRFIARNVVVKDDVKFLSGDVQIRGAGFEVSAAGADIDMKNNEVVKLRGAARVKLLGITPPLKP